MRFRAALAAPLAAAAVWSFAAPGPATELRYVAFLRPDPARKRLMPEEGQGIMEAHMANIRSMADRGLLVAAGPMDDSPTTISGVFVLSTPSIGEAMRIALQDPTVTAGLNTVDVHPWQAPAGIGKAYFKWKRTDPGPGDEMAVHAFCILRHGRSWTPQPGSGSHEAFIEVLRRAGILAAAGPVPGDAEISGIVIFKTASAQEARRSMEQDPDVASGRLAVEYHRWWTADRVLPW
ncbi:MAG TPA: YciI family protein [Opitutaceae bacterium]|jgi:uncharacterized protein YciI